MNRPTVTDITDSVVGALSSETVVAIATDTARVLVSVFDLDGVMWVQVTTTAGEVRVSQPVRL